jgi:hypothetical protein
MRTGAHREDFLCALGKGSCRDFDDGGMPCNSAEGFQYTIIFLHSVHSFLKGKVSRTSTDKGRVMSRHVPLPFLEFLLNRR